MNKFFGTGRALAVAAALVCLAASPCAAGSCCGNTQTSQTSQIVLHVPVEWNGEWYTAQILRSSSSGHLVHYVGYDGSWDEWVGADRIGIIDCLVEYGGEWYEAQILFGDG